MIQKALYSCGKEFVWGAYKKSELLAKEAEEYLSKSVSKGTTFSFAPLKPVRHTFSFGTTSAVENATREMTGATQIAEYNKAMINFGKMKKTASFGKATRVNPNFVSEYDLMLNDMKKIYGEKNIEHFINYSQNNTELAIKSITETFEKRTGIKLHCPTTYNLNSFLEGIHRIDYMTTKGIFPKDIKHVLIGHGTGYSLAKGNDGIPTWAFAYCGAEENRIFQYINKNPNIKKDDLILTLCCEEPTKIQLINIPRPIDKNGIGKHVLTDLTVASQPAKLIKAGDNKICGEFYVDCVQNFDNPVLNPEILNVHKIIY